MRALARPTQQISLYEPHTGQVTVYETIPHGRARGFRGHCKYCGRTHNQWWQMYPAGHDGDNEMLCGYCEYTSDRALCACERNAP